MVTKGLLVRLHAQAGKEDDVVNFIDGVMPLIRAETATTLFLGVRIGPSDFGIINAFPDEAGRDGHIAGDAARALFARSGEFLASAPEVQMLDVLAQKLPSGGA